MIAGVAGLAAAASSVGMLIVTADGRVAWVNDALVELVTGTPNPDSPVEARRVVAEAGLPLTGLHPAVPPAIVEWTGVDGAPRLLRITCRDMSAGQPSELLLFEIVDLTDGVVDGYLALPPGSTAEQPGDADDPDLVSAVLATAILEAAGSSGAGLDTLGVGDTHRGAHDAGAHDAGGPGYGAPAPDLGDHGAPARGGELVVASAPGLPVPVPETIGTAGADGSDGRLGPGLDGATTSAGADPLPAAHLDPLTGLLDRYSLAEDLDARIAGPDGATGSLLLLDVDNLADVNDLQGYSVGDAVLCAVAEALRAELPETAVLGRLGGDEFAVLVPDATGAAGPAMAEKLRTVIAARTAAPDAAAVQTTVSVGVVPLELAAGSEAAFAWADLALREAKRAGRNRVRLFSREQYDEAALRVTVTSRVAAALDNGQMSLDVLPVVDLASREVIGFELLSRLRDGVWPEVGPRGFLTAAEHTDLGLHLDRWVVLQAANALNGGLPGRLYVNLSARSLRDPAFGDFVLSTLRDNRVDPSRLGLEISEVAAVANLDAARRLAEQLGAAGCPMLLDDFGISTGAVLALRDLPLWAVKIDATIVRMIDSSPRDRALVEAVVQIARSAGMSVIAEGVDRGALPQILLDLGVGVAQGYHVGRPRRLTELLGVADGGDITTVMTLGGRR